ncbi:HEAT repeat domain-containing protein [Nocardia sp. NPDC057663]|uniref:HEAT repeat domain-containing protein n=1 Tax=Nocardia sp. NPDC057663 TaxID=3346201 RepID=UPI00366F0486
MRIRARQWDVRCAAARALGGWLPDREVFSSLVGALNDGDIAVQIAAAEQLVRFGGKEGLEAVLTELGRRVDDPDADYIAYQLRELELFDQLPILESAQEFGSELSEDGRVGRMQLEELLGGSTST